MFSEVRNLTALMDCLRMGLRSSPTLSCCTSSSIMGLSVRAISSTPTLGFEKMIRRDKARRKCVAKHARERLQLKAIVKNKLLSEIVQRKAKEQLANQPRDASVTRVRNRCVMTGRGRGVITEYGLCRMKFRKLADFGHISGMTRSTW